MRKLLALAEWISTTFADVPPLVLRLIVAYGFYTPALTKIKNVPAFAEWLGTLGVPVPMLNAYLALATEAAGVILLILGLGTRFITIPLMFVMVIAITTVHWAHGFSCAENGYQIPLYYFLLLFCLLITGPGRFSFDDVIKRQRRVR